ncbi:MAG: fucose isomerase, partial [bacterium]
ISLGNFGPEGPTTILARELGVPFMLVGAAEETGHDLINGRGDAFCGMLSAVLNTGLRRLTPYLPPRPIGSAREVAQSLRRFSAIARVLVGVRGLKVISFGPRPQDFYACNAPIQPLYDLGIEVMENSELDLHLLYESMAGRTREIAAIAKDMARELGAGNKHPGKLRELAQYELALTEFHKRNLGARSFAVYAKKCWPGFEPGFGFVPCFVNSRLAARGIPVACESDIYGAVSEYLVQLAADHPVAFLDINNTVPDDLPIADLKGVPREDLFMGFHCGNTASCLLCPGFAMKYQLIMHRLMEPGKKPDITVGTLEGTLRPGAVTVFRLVHNSRGQTRGYVIEGDVLEADPRSFGSIGVIGCPGFGRFYRHVMLEHQYPHHAVLGYTRSGGILFDALRMLGVTVDVPVQAGARYPSENPFA